MIRSLHVDVVAGLDDMNNRRHVDIVAKRIRGKSAHLIDATASQLGHDLRHGARSTRVTCNVGNYSGGQLNSNNQPIIKDLMFNVDLWLILLKAFPHSKLVDTEFMNFIFALIKEDQEMKTRQFEVDLFVAWFARCCTCS